MAGQALLLYAILAAVTFGVRVAVQVRRTGATGLHGLPSGAGAQEWLAGSLFVAGLAIVAIALVLDLAGKLEPIGAIGGTAAGIAGTVLAVSGICLTFAAQLAMGDAWRVGVDPGERTELVVDGPFALVRNPIYSAMMPTFLGLVLMAPSALAIAGMLILLVGLELQVRLVEEPYLLRAHGEAYAAYASRVGRFLPRLGLLRSAQTATIAVLGAAMGLGLLAPPRAAALDSDLKGFAAFELQASHGYSILGLASSERIDGRGGITLIVYRKGASVFYEAPATVTPTMFEADLGALGRISAEIVPSGRKKTLHPLCGEDVHGVEPNLYRGTFEFHGELGYTDAIATKVPEDAGFLLNVICPGVGQGEESGAGLPGARLRAVSRHGAHRLSLQLNKNGPGKPTVFSATLAERRDGIRIKRFVSGRRPAAAFDYDPLLRTATVAPPAPFSGSATFSRRAPRSNRWTGSLAVDFPGEHDVPLTGAGFSVRIAHAWQTS